MKTHIEESVKSNGENLKTRVAAVEVTAIKTSKALRAACEQNYCGHYGTNWGCPPGVGSYEELSERLKDFTDAVLVQSIHQLEDSFDYEGMKAAKDKHVSLFRKVRDELRATLFTGHPEGLLGLNVGECTICETCTYPEGKPCRFPDQAIASLESYCINVNALLTRCGLEYNNGVNTVSYVSLFLSR